MTSVEKLNAAIAKLETLKKASTPGLWSLRHPMTGIDPARLKANTPTAKRRRWLTQHLTAWTLAVLFIAGPIILINQIERLFT